MKNGRGLIRTVALLVCLVMIGTLLPLAASAALPTPKLNSAKADGEGIRVSWQAVTGADSYRVYRKDANTGWKAGAEYSDFDLPDYDEIVENEFGEKKKKASPLAIAAAIIVALAFIATMIF